MCPAAPQCVTYVSRDNCNGLRDTSSFFRCLHIFMPFLKKPQTTQPRNTLRTRGVGEEEGLPTSNFWKNEKKCVFNIRTFKVFYRCSRRLVRHTWRCPKATDKASLGPLRGTGIQEGEERFAGRNGGEWYIPDLGKLIYHSGKSMIFYLSGPPNILLLTTSLYVPQDSERKNVRFCD